MEGAIKDDGVAALGSVNAKVHSGREFIGISVEAASTLSHGHVTMTTDGNITRYKGHIFYMKCFESVG